MEEAAAASVLAVLSSDDLVREILVRLGFATYLVHAALVSKRWLRLISDPAFLRRFREFHPPRLLGFYLSHSGAFLPVSQAPELATPVRCAASLSGDDYLGIKDCRNGRLLVKLPDRRGVEFAVLSPLHRARGMVLLPPSWKHEFRWIFLPEDGGGIDGVIALDMPFLQTGLFCVRVFSLRSRIWKFQTWATIELTQPLPAIKYVLPPVHGKIYMLTNSGYILVLDTLAGKGRLSVLQLPDGVRSSNFRLSCGEDSGLFVIYAEGSLLRVWHRKTDNDGTGRWVQVDDGIRVCEACNREEQEEDVLVLGVDGNAEFVLLRLETSGTLIYMHLRSRTEKVFNDRELHYMRNPMVFPFLMVWRPKFPPLREDGDHRE